MPEIKEPSDQLDKNEWISGNWDGDCINRHRYMYMIKNDETFDGIIQRLSGKPVPGSNRCYEENLTKALLCKHNYNTSDPQEINWYLSNFNGYTKTDSDNANFILNSTDACPWIWIPLSKTKFSGKSGTKITVIIPTDYKKLFIKGMKYAAKAIESITDFGLPWGNFNCLVESETLIDEEKYDVEHFSEAIFKHNDRGTERFVGKLNVLSDSYSEAIGSIFKTPEKWKLECAVATEVVRLGGILHMTGDDFNEFVISYLSYDEYAKKNVFELKPWESTPFKNRKYYQRKSIESDDWDIKDLKRKRQYEVTKELSVMLTERPPGTRITWASVSKTIDFETYHNTLKVDDNLYMLNYASLAKKLFTYSELYELIGKSYHVKYMIETNDIVKEYSDWKKSEK